jgi:hypothetical protein
LQLVLLPDATASESPTAFPFELDVEVFWFRIHLLPPASGAVVVSPGVSMSSTAVHSLPACVTMSPATYWVPETHEPLLSPVGDSWYVVVVCMPTLQTETEPATPTNPAPIESA